MLLVKIRTIEGAIVQINPEHVVMVGPAMQYPAGVPREMGVPKLVGTMIKLVEGTQVVTAENDVEVGKMLQFPVGELN